MQHFWEDGLPASAVFAINNLQLAAVKIEVVDPQPEGLFETQPAGIDHLDNELMGIVLNMVNDE